MSTINANSFNDAAGTGAPDFPNGLTSGGLPVGGTKAWAIVTDYSAGDVVYSEGADSTLNKIYKASSTHTSGAVSLLADIANWTELSEQSTVPYNIVISPGDDIKSIIDAAVSGDNVYIKDGTYVTDAIIVPKGISITGQSRSGVIISGGDSDEIAFDMRNYNTVTQTSRLTTLEREWDSAVGDGTATATYGSTLVTLSQPVLAQTETGFISLDGVDYSIVATPTTSTLTLGEEYQSSNNTFLPYQIREGTKNTITLVENLTVTTTSTGFGAFDALGIDMSDSADIHLKNVTVDVRLGFIGAIVCERSYKNYFENVEVICSTGNAIVYGASWLCTATNLNIMGGIEFKSGGSQKPNYRLTIDINRINSDRDHRGIFFQNGGGFFRGSLSIKSYTGELGQTPIQGFNGGFVQSVLRVDYLKVAYPGPTGIDFDQDVIEGNTFHFGWIEVPGHTTEIINIKSHDSTAGRANVIVSGTLIGTAGVQGCVVGSAVQADAYADTPVQNNGYTF